MNQRGGQIMTPNPFGAAWPPLADDIAKDSGGALMVKNELK